MAPSRRQKAKPKFEFFQELPPELRAMVYEYAIPRGRKWASGFRVPKRIPGLLLVSRDVRAECMPIWLANNRFRLQARLDLTSILKPGPYINTRLFWTSNRSLRFVQTFEWSLGMSTNPSAVASYNAATNYPISGDVWIYVKVDRKTCTIKLEKPRLGGSQSGLEHAWLAEGNVPRAETKARRMVEVLEDCMERSLSVESVTVVTV